jgi:polygalacturonase
MSSRGNLRAGPVVLALAALCGWLVFPFAAAGAICDAVTVCGAVADNATNAAPALSSCVAPGVGPCGGAGSTLVLPAGAAFLVGSVDFSNTVNLTVRFGSGAGLYGSADRLYYPLQAQLPPTNMPGLGGQWRALLYARNVSGLTLEGPPSAVVDGLGWPWWAAFANGTLKYQRPKLVEIVDGVDVVLRGLTFRNSPFWTLHTLYCSRVAFLELTVLAPRAVGNTDVCFDANHPPTMPPKNNPYQNLKGVIMLTHAPKKQPLTGHRPRFLHRRAHRLVPH